MNKIVALALTLCLVLAAVPSFAAELLGYDSEAGTYAKNTLSLPADYSTSGEYSFQIVARQGLTTTTPEKYLTPEIVMTDGKYLQKFASYDVTGCMTSLQTSTSYKEMGHDLFHQ